MFVNKRWVLIAALTLASTCVGQTVTTWHYDNMRTGTNPRETILTPANVNPTTFGKLFSQPVDGTIVGEALYMPGLPVPGQGIHNVVYVATMHDSVYAFDADSNTGSNAAPLWKQNVAVPGATSVPIAVQKGGAITGWTEVGVVSTPVIDGPTDTLYVVAKDYLNGVATNRLWGLSLYTGAVKFTVPISATYTAGGTTTTFSNLSQVNRPALLLSNGVIYIAFGGNGSNGNHQGWVLAYSRATSTSPTPQQVGVWTDEPGSIDGGIWQMGGGLSADNSGVFGETGEGSVVPGTNFGTSIFKLSHSATGLTLADYFTPYNWNYLRTNDLDLNDSVLILPTQAGSHPYLAIAVGKEGTLYLLNRTNLGGLCPSSTCTSTDSQIVQELHMAVGHGTSSLVYWNNRVYSSAVATPIEAWSLSNGLLSNAPVAVSPKVAAGHSPVLSANGTTNGILWQLNGSGPNALQAFDALSLKRIYNANQTNGRDALPAMPHFAQLLEVHGKVYVGTNTTLEVFGLL